MQPHYHSLQPIRVSTRDSITINYLKLFVVWRRCGLGSYSSSEATISFIPSLSRLMGPRSFRGLKTRPSEFGIRALALRCFHRCETMIILFGLSHSHPMDPKLFRGLKTRPF